MSIKAIKFEDITVTFHPTKPSKPIMIETEKKQLKRGINTHKKLLKTNQRVNMIKEIHQRQILLCRFLCRSSYHQQSLGFLLNEF